VKSLLKLFAVIVMLSICAIPARSTSNCGYARYALAGDVKTIQSGTGAILQEIVTCNIKCTNSANNNVYDTTSDSVTATGGKGGQHAAPGTTWPTFNTIYYPCNAVFSFSSYSTTDISGPEPSFTLSAQEYQINSNQNPGNTPCLQTSWSKPPSTAIKWIV